MKRSRRRAALLFAFLLFPAIPQTQESTPVHHARSVLEQGAVDSDPDTRREVALALGMVSKRDSTVPLLEKLAADKDHLVRETAMVSIGELRDIRLAKSAQAGLEDDVPEVAFAAART